MSTATSWHGESSCVTAPVQSDPPEWIRLRDRVRRLPSELSAELETIVEEAIDQAQMQGRVVRIARDALLRLRLDLELARFDLEATRRERQELRSMLDQASAAEDLGG